MSAVVQKYKSVTDIATSQAFTVVGYQPKVSITWQEWVDDGDKIRNVGVYAKFLAGDWVNAGQQRFGEKYAQALNNGWNLNTISKCAWVARCIAPEARIAAFDLSFSHSELIAKQGFEPKLQAAWLDMARAEGWTTMDLANAIAVAGAKTAVKVDTEPPAMDELSPPESVPFDGQANSTDDDVTPDDDTPIDVYGEAVDDSSMAEEAAYRIGVGFCDLTREQGIGVEIEDCFNDFAMNGERTCVLVPVQPSASWWTLLRDFPLCLLMANKPLAVVGIGVPLSDFAREYADLGDTYVRQEVD